MKTGITGLPYSGKTTLFCALTGQSYEALSHGKDIHMGTIKVPDERLDRLYAMFTPKRCVYATMEFFDVAGQQAGQGKAMDAKVLQTLKNADSLIAVVDAYSDDARPRTEFNSLMDEFVFNDLVVVTSRLERIEKDMRSGKRDDLIVERAALERAQGTLEEGNPLRGITFTDDEARTLRGFQFLSLKHMLIVLNISEALQTGGGASDLEAQFADVPDAMCVSICAEIEMQIAMLDPEERPLFLESMGIQEPAAGRVIRLGYENMGLMSFFTAGGNDEVRAWPVRRGATAPECAGVIHSDLERGFIRAEVVSFDDLMETGSFKAAREKGLLGIEGKDYIVHDGDILNIRFSV